MIAITKEFTFDAAHRLGWHKGKCRRLHGHTYKLQVSIKGPLNENGIVMDFGDFKKFVEKEIINKLDHQYLNEIIENPTAENIVLWIVSRLSKIPIRGLTLVKLWETPTSFVEWRPNES